MVVEIMTITNLLRSILKLLMKENRDMLKLKPHFAVIFLICRSMHEGPWQSHHQGGHRPQTEKDLSQALVLGTAAEPKTHPVTRH